MTTLAEHVLSKARSVGYLTEIEAMAMMAFAHTIPEGGVVVNIGAGAGTSALALRAGGARDIVTVDMRDGGPYGGLESERNAFDEAGLYGEYPHQVLGDSGDVGFMRAHEFNAWAVFIDADHTRAGLLKDIAAWAMPSRARLPKLLMFHDYGRAEWPDVKEVIDELLTDNSTWHMVGVFDTLAVVLQD